MNNEVLYRGYITEFDSDLTYTRKEEILYRIISIKDTFFFAEEISTGCIFPVYNFAESRNYRYNQGIKFNSYSYETVGKYYVFCPLKGTETPFKFCIAEHENITNPSIYEVNKYLKFKTNNRSWLLKMTEYENKNKYSFSTSVLKEIINKEKNKNVETIQTEEIKNEENIYVPCIDIQKIESYGYDMSLSKVKQPFIGRTEETKRIIKGIAIKEKSILIIGPPGSGKTSLVENIAEQIRNGQDNWLQDKMIFSMNPSKTLLDTKYRGEFEKNFQEIIDFVAKSKHKIILFIDEIHTLYGLGRTADSTIDAMNILKPYLSSGDITIIGATTNEEYHKYMANDQAFIERFELLHLSKIDEELNVKIILSYINKLEEKYNINLNLNEEEKVQLVRYIINITDKKNQRIVGDSIQISNPRITKTIIEEAFAEALYENKKKVTIEELYLAIITCDKFSPTFRKEKAEELRNKLTREKTGNKKRIISLT